MGNISICGVTTYKGGNPMAMVQMPTYFILNQTLVGEDTSLNHREIIRENVVELGNSKLFTLTFNQVLQDFGIRNWNGRNYSEPIVVGGLDKNPLIQHDIKMKTWTGEYGHPLIEKGMNELQRQMTIHPPNACWTIDKYWVSGNLLMGQCTTLSGGYGDMVRDRVLTGYPAMASSRAIGGVDKNGNVLPGYTPITFDCVIRPSHKVAYKVNGSEHLNTFPITTDLKNTMSECAIPYDYTKDPAFGDFLLSESTSRQQIDILCDTFKLDYSSMKVEKNFLMLESVSGNGMLTEVRIPLRKMVAAEYWNLFM